jgi:hypothetical protein
MMQKEKEQQTSLDQATKKRDMFKDQLLRRAMLVKLQQDERLELNENIRDQANELQTALATDMDELVTRQQGVGCWDSSSRFVVRGSGTSLGPP